MYFLKQCENNDHEVLIKEREAKRHVTRSSRMNNRPRSDGAAPAWNGMTLTSASSVRPSVSFWAFGPLGRPGWMEKKLDGRSSSLFSRPPGATRAVWALSNESCQPPAAFSWRGDPSRRHAPCRAGRSAPRHRWLCLLRSDSGLGCRHRREFSPPRLPSSFVTTRARGPCDPFVKLSLSFPRTHLPGARPTRRCCLRTGRPSLPDLTSSCLFSCQ